MPDLAHPLRALARIAALGTAALTLALAAGCATAPSTTLESRAPVVAADQGLVTLRLVNASTTTLRRIVVRSVETGQELPMTVEQFGQTHSATFVARLPAGRWQPRTLEGSRDLFGITVPIEKYVAPFEVRAGRVTDMRTLVFTSLDETMSAIETGKGGSMSYRTAFRLSVDHTPVPVDALLRARWPDLAGTLLAQPPLDWDPGSEAADPGALTQARKRAPVVTNPLFVTPELMLAGGPMGSLSTWDLRTGKYQRESLPSIHGVQAYEALADGRWIAGGEEGFVAVRETDGRWKALDGKPVGAGDVVLLIKQGEDGAVWMAVDRMRGVAVYRADAKALSQWTLVKELPSDRGFDQSATNEILFGSNKLSDYAVASRERLVVVTHPKKLHSMDLRSGQWESHETPRVLRMGLKITPDGFITGVWGPDWITTSTDYGKNWTRMSSWVNMSQAHFVDRSRGWTLVNDLGLMGPQKQHVHATSNGGQAWTQGVQTNSKSFENAWLTPFWTDPGGKVMFRVVSNSYLQVSRDGGATWVSIWEDSRSADPAKPAKPGAAGGLKAALDVKLR